LLIVYSNRNLHGIDEVTEISDLSTKEQVAKLGEGKEDDHKHDKKADNVFFSLSKSSGELRHGLVEADILKYLQVRV